MRFPCLHVACPLPAGSILCLIAPWLLALTDIPTQQTTHWWREVPQVLLFWPSKASTHGGIFRWLLQGRSCDFCFSYWNGKSIIWLLLKLLKLSFSTGIPSPVERWLLTLKLRFVVYNKHIGLFELGFKFFWELVCFEAMTSDKNDWVWLNEIFWVELTLFSLFFL